MRIVTNPGSNLSPEALAHYDIETTPQSIVVDGVAHDSRASIGLSDVDAWVQTARDFPHVVGTTASEFVATFGRLLREDDDLVAVTTSRKIVQSYAAAVSAVNVVRARPLYEKARIAVIDSTVTDVGAALVTLVAGEAARAGVPHSLAVATLSAMGPRIVSAVSVSTLVNLVRGGRAGFLRAWLANVLDRKPIIAFVNGELTVAGTMSGKGDRAEAIGDHLVRSMSRAKTAKRVWVGIAHGNQFDEAARLEKRLRAVLPVEYVYRRPISPSIYLHVGPGSLLVAVLPVDHLPWSPTVPPDFSEPR